MSIKAIGNRLIRNLSAALDPAVPTDRTIKNFLLKNESTIRFSATPPAEYRGAMGGFDSQGLPQFRFRHEGGLIYAVVDKPRNQVFVIRGWSDPDYAVVPFSRMTNKP